MFIEANIHAREWISSATATYLIHQLLTSPVPAIVDLAENIDWHIIPVMNPGKNKSFINIFHHI